MYPFLIKAYNQILAGQTGENVVREVLAMIDEKKNLEIAKNNQRQETLAHLKSQFDELSAVESPIGFLLRENETEDVETLKTEEYLAQQSRQRLSAQNEIDELQNEYQQLDLAISKSRLEKRDLESQLDRQEISPQEALELARERESLRNGIKEFQERSVKLSEELRLREDAVARARGSFERSLAKYKTVVSGLGLSLDIPYDPFAINSTPAQLAPRANVRPALIRERSKRSSEKKPFVDALTRAQKRYIESEDEIRDLERTLMHENEILDTLTIELRSIKAFFEENSTKISHESKVLAQETKTMLEY